ncbi:MAG TPA: glycosyltransferase family 1 protein [Rubrivivax sp.]|nr:glycosyltransferase family 1 protein [Rubrivivax sp.]
MEPGALVLDSTRLAGRFLKGLRPTGIDRVCLAYQRRYGAGAHAAVGIGGRQYLMSARRSERLFELLAGADQSTPAVQVHWLSRLQALARTLAPLQKPPSAPLRTRAHPLHGAPLAPARWLLNVGHSGLEHVGYTNWLVRRRLRAVFMLHDLIPLTHPEFAVPGGAERHRRRLATMLKRAQGLILNSQATLQVLQEYAAAAALPLPPCVVAALGVDLAADGTAGSGRLPLEVHGPYFVMLGTIESRKGHWLMLQLWRRLVQTMGPTAPKLVIIGRRGWEAENAFDMLERCDTLRGVVHEVQACSDAQLVNWLRGAHALLFPSFAEGFGLPLAEALSLGTPVIASDLPVFLETAPQRRDLAVYLDPLDGRGWMQAIRSQAALDAPSLAAQRAQLQRSFRAPSWAQHFDTVDTFMAGLQHGSGAGVQ